MEALQYDLGRTKDAVEGRFQTAEGWLAELQTSHRVLAEEMRESQASLREEVQTKLETLQSVEKKSPGTTLSPSFRASAVELEETRTSQASVKQERQTKPGSSEEKSTGSASSPPLRASAVEFITTVNSFLAGADGGIHRTCTGGGVLHAATTTVRRAFISGGLPGPIRDVEPAEPLDRDREGHTTGGEPKRSGPDCLVQSHK